MKGRAYHFTFQLWDTCLNLAAAVYIRQCIASTYQSWQWPYQNVPTETDSETRSQLRLSWYCVRAMWGIKVKVKLFLCLTNKALCHEGVWGQWSKFSWLRH
jgi:hypothetical protein